MSDEVRQYKYLYVLYYIDPTDQEEYIFYVGKTNNPSQRRAGHLSKSKTGTEDKYRFIRETLDPANIPWQYRVFKDVPKEDYCHDWERWWVIHYVREGHPIKNMKHGDLDSTVVREQVADHSIRGVADVKRDRIARERKAFEKSERLIDKILKVQPEPTSQQRFLNKLTNHISFRKTLINKLNEPGWKKGTEEDHQTMNCLFDSPSQVTRRPQYKEIDGVRFIRGRTVDKRYVMLDNKYNELSVGRTGYKDCQSAILRPFLKDNNE